MPTLLKSLFDRKREPTPEESKAMDCARMALQGRVDRMLRQDALRHADVSRPTTDAYGRALQ